MRNYSEILSPAHNILTKIGINNIVNVQQTTTHPFYGGNIELLYAKRKQLCIIALSSSPPDEIKIGKEEYLKIAKTQSTITNTAAEIQHEYSLWNHQTQILLPAQSIEKINSNLEKISNRKREANYAYDEVYEIYKKRNSICFTEYQELQSFQLNCLNEIYQLSKEISENVDTALKKIQDQTGTSLKVTVPLINIGLLEQIKSLNEAKTELLASLTRPNLSDPHESAIIYSQRTHLFNELVEAIRKEEYHQIKEIQETIIHTVTHIQHKYSNWTTSTQIPPPTSTKEKINGKLEKIALLQHEAHKKYEAYTMRHTFCSYQERRELQVFQLHCLLEIYQLGTELENNVNIALKDVEHLRKQIKLLNKTQSKHEQLLQSRKDMLQRYPHTAHMHTPIAERLNKEIQMLKNVIETLENQTPKNQIELLRQIELINKMKSEQEETLKYEKNKFSHSKIFDHQTFSLEQEVQVWQNILETLLLHKGA